VLLTAMIVIVGGASAANAVSIDDGI